MLTQGHHEYEIECIVIVSVIFDRRYQNNGINSRRRLQHEYCDLRRTGNGNASYFPRNVSFFCYRSSDASVPGYLILGSIKSPRLRLSCRGRVHRDPVEKPAAILPSCLSCRSCSVCSSYVMDFISLPLGGIPNSPAYRSANQIRGRWNERRNLRYQIHADF